MRQESDGKRHRLNAYANSPSDYRQASSRLLRAMMHFAGHASRPYARVALSSFADSIEIESHAR